MMKAKAKKLGHTNFIGSPEALKHKAHEKMESYKQELAEHKKKRKHEKAETMKRIKSVKVKYL